MQVRIEQRHDQASNMGLRLSASEIDALRKEAGRQRRALVEAGHTHMAQARRLREGGLRVATDTALSEAHEAFSEAAFHEGRESVCAALLGVPIAEAAHYWPASAEEVSDAQE